MRTRTYAVLLGAFFTAFTQQSQAQLSNANNNSSSSTTTNAMGNAQSITFNSPATVTSSSSQNIVSSGTTGQDVNYAGSYTIKNVPSVSGPNLTTSNDTCMGSSSGSANGAGFGVSFGTTWTDEHCKRMKMSRELWNKGMKAASLAMDCMDPEAKAALEMTGTKCPQSMTPEERTATFGPFIAASASVPPQQKATVAVASPVPDATATPMALPPAPKVEAAAAVAATASSHDYGQDF